MYKNRVEENVTVRTNINVNKEIRVFDYSCETNMYKKNLNVIWEYWNKKHDIDYKVKIICDDITPEEGLEVKKGFTEIKVKLSKEARDNLQQIGIKTGKKSEYIKFTIFESDTSGESKEGLKELFLNYNSLHLLLNGCVKKYKRYISKLEHFKKQLQIQGFYLDDFVIVSSGVLGIYGMREPTDIDFVTLEMNYKDVCDEIIDCHHHVIETYGLSKDEFINNPDNYVYWGGIKYACLDSVYNACVNRVQKTKKIDALLIEVITGKRRYRRGEIFFLKMQHSYLRKIREMIKSNPKILKWIDEKEDKGILLLFIPIKRKLYRYMYY